MTDRQRRGPRWAPGSPIGLVGGRPFAVLTDLFPGSTGPRATGGVALVDDPTTVALAATVTRTRGIWIGRAGDAKPRSVVRRRALTPDPADVADYECHARSTIWPVYHGLGTARFDQDWRTGYRWVNAAFAAAAAEEVGAGGTVWVLHHQLQLVPGMLRRIRPDLRIGFSLQTPFPQPRVFESTPVHQELLRGLLGADLIGFQTAGCADNFLRLIRDAIGPPPSVGVFPDAADTRAIAAMAGRPDVIARAQALRRRLGSPRSVILSLDGSDGALPFEQGAGAGDVLTELADSVVIQVLPSHGNGPLRPAARAILPAGVGRSRLHTFVATPDLTDRVVLYLCADIMLATPARDGAMTTALEFAAAARDDAALVLSEQCATASVFSSAYLVDASDACSVRAGLAASLGATGAERTCRIARMREQLTHHDVFALARDFLASLRLVPVPETSQSPREPSRVPDGVRRGRRSLLSVHSGGLP